MIEITPEDRLEYEKFRVFSRMAAREDAEAAARAEQEAKAKQAPAEPPELSYLDKIAANLLAQRQQHNGRGLVSR